MKPEKEAFVIKMPKKITPPEGWRLPSDKERDKLGQMSTEIDRLRELIKVTSGDRKKEYIMARRDLNATLINYTEKKKIYYVPGMQIQIQRAKFVESLVEETKRELLLELRHKGP